MRVSPTVTPYSTQTGTTNRVWNEGAAADQTLNVQFQGQQSFHVWVGAGTISAGQVCNFQYTADAEL
jgi:hypothetical protein